MENQNQCFEDIFIKKTSVSIQHRMSIQKIKYIIIDVKYTFYYSKQLIRTSVPERHPSITTHRQNILVLIQQGTEKINMSCNHP